MRWRTAIVAVGLVAFPVALGCRTASDSGGAARVLGPSVAPALMQLLVADGFKIEGISVANNAVVANLCDASARCFEARLSDPRATCAGEVVEPWCLRFGAAVPSSETQLALRRTVSRQHDDDVWTALNVAPPAPHRWTSAEGTDLPYYLLGVAAVLGPFVLGWSLGLAFLFVASRRVRPVYFTTGMVVVSGAVLVGLAVSEALPISFWDEAALLGLLSVGAAMAAQAGTPRAACLNTALFIASSAVSLTVGEIATRMFAPTPPGFPPAHEAHIRLPERGPGMCEMRNCGSLELVYPERSTGMLERLLAPAAAAPSRVLHVGDSIVWGVGVERDEAFPALLDVMDKPVAHVTGSGPGTGPDVYYLVTKALLDRLHPSLVVWYLQPSDYKDIDQPYAYCEDGPLLDYVPGGPRPRCPEPRWARAEGGFMGALRPAPYALRVATGYSFLARHIVGLLWRLPLTEVLQCNHLRDLLAATRDLLGTRHVAFEVVQDPDSVTLGERLAHRVPSETICSNARVVRSLDIPFLDGNDAFAEVAASDGIDALFLPRDCHFNPNGHRVFAAWLKDHLIAAAQAGVDQPRHEVGAQEETP